ncbi:PIG-L deacetylase family protein [Marinicrinis lubricantis]|uniref:PIG-L deacetylase family protein n=1 Tax=Marinicrinis lubricantis TaxID=2086470 RepID=A0ABW1IQQ8_9BACL
MGAIQKILILAPHTDDGELGCGATIHKWAREGKEVHYVAFSAAEESVPSSFPKDELRREALQSTMTLGIPATNVEILKYPVRKFTEYRQNILEDLIQKRKDLQPDLILLPSLHDIHQDHQVVTMEGIRAFKLSSILAYELPWNTLTYDHTCYSIVDEKDLDKKYEALQHYKTQQHRAYFDKQFIYGLAKTRGTQYSVPYAECFEVIRWVV